MGKRYGASMIRVSCFLGIFCLILSGAALGEGASGPPAPVPYKPIADPPDDAERRIVVTAQDRGPVWLLTGFLHGWEPGITFERLARVKTKHLRTGIWPFWYPRSLAPGGKEQWSDYRDSPVVLGEYLQTMLRMREQGMTWQVLLHYKGRYSGWLSIINDGGEALKGYSDHIYTLVKYARMMGLPVDYWEVTNEPAHPYNTEENPGGYFKHSWQDFLTFWDTNYDAIRAADPTAKIVGPSFGGAGEGDMVTSMDAFLSHCRDKGQKVDALSWHINCVYKGSNGEYWDEVDCVHRQIENVRKLVENKFPMVRVETYHLDEWGYYLEYTGLGAQIAYLYYMDLAGLDRAAKTGPPYMMSATRISPETPRAADWAWVEYAKQDGGLRLVTETNDRCFVALASRHDEEQIMRALVGRAKHQSLAAPPEAAPNWKWGDDPPAKPPVTATIDFAGLPIAGQAEVSILRLPPGTGPLYEDELDGLTTTQMMNVTGGGLTIKLEDIAENTVFSIIIGPEGTYEKEKAEAQRWAEPAGEEEGQLSERELHHQGTQKAKQAAAAGAIRIACGAALAFTDPAGNGWFADREYSEGEFGYLGGGTVDRGPIPIAGTDNPQLYRTELWGMKGYRITVPDGKYRLRLHWAETYGLAAGGRTCDVAVEGKIVLKDFDAAREAGGLNKAVVRELDVEVTDGVLDITFPHAEEVTPMINGIEVIKK